MGLEQYPFHNPEIPTLTKQIGTDLELEVIPKELVQEAISRFDVSALNMDVVNKILEDEAEVLMSMGDSSEAIADGLDYKLRQLGAKKLG